MEYYVLKPTISNERYEKILEYNRNYYANMSVERKAEYIEMKKLYNRRYREQKKRRSVAEPLTNG